MGMALFRRAYRDLEPDQPVIEEESYLSLVFTLRRGRWLMIHDQNMSIRSGSVAN
jgi:hypothetical protein